MRTIYISIPEIPAPKTNLFRGDLIEALNYVEKRNQLTHLQERQLCDLRIRQESRSGADEILPDLGGLASDICAGMLLRPGREAEQVWRTYQPENM